MSDQRSVVSEAFSTVAVGSWAAGSATTEASTQPTSRLMRSRWAPVQAPSPRRPLTSHQIHPVPHMRASSLSQAWVQGPVVHWLAPYRLDREAAGEMDIGDIEVFIGTGRR